MMPTLPCLPPSLLAYILEFALPCFTQDLAPQSPSLPLKQLKDVALVSKNMLGGIQTLVDDYRAATCRLDVAEPDSIDQFPARGPTIRDLRVQCNPSICHFLGTEKVETPTINWDIVLGSMAGLKRLDLGQMPILDGHVPEMLEAASTYCLYLEFLILPQPSEFDEWPSMEDVVAPVVLGLERWHSKGYCGGLKQLIVPMYPGQNLHRQETEFLEGITEYCPRIEFLNSCDDIDREVEARRVWSVSSETWEKFNASCTALKQFSFALVPFADPFFRVFGEYVKPHLKVNLSANSTCDFEQYFRDVDGLSDQNSLRPGYGVLASSPSSALKRCPALTTLFIQIDYYDSEDSHELEGRYVNADVYGDTFWEAVAEYCPLLESIEMIDPSSYRTYNVFPIETLTGRTLLALAGLTRLSAVELAPARLIGEDIFEYIRCLSKVEDTMGTQQDIHLKVGGHERATFSLPSFYLESLTLLVLLSQESEESLGASTCRQKPVVHVWNPYRSRVSPPWSYGYLTKDLRTALEAVKEAHPSLGVAVHIQGRDFQFSGLSFKTQDRRETCGDWERTTRRVRGY
ncbi:hypothetical protein PR003_g22755 [Phytophthora rubi]|nr:hypothetical protein PR003_g22755 [Phytophthora rubi]